MTHALAAGAGQVSANPPPVVKWSGFCAKAAGGPRSAAVTSSAVCVRDSKTHRSCREPHDLERKTASCRYSVIWPCRFHNIGCIVFSCPWLVKDCNLGNVASYK